MSSDNDPPLLTVFIPTVGRTEFLGEAIRSLELTADLPVEVVVGYHGCEPVAARWLAELPLPASRVRTYTIPAGGGMSANWNHGLAGARGRWFFPLADDDRLRPGGLAALLRAAAESSADVVAFRHRVVDAAGAVMARRTVEMEPGYFEARRDGDVQTVTAANALPTPPVMSSLLRTAWAREVGFRTETGSAADFDFFIRAALGGYRLECRRESVADYRQHGESTSEGGTAWELSFAVLGAAVARAPELAVSPLYAKRINFLWWARIGAAVRNGRFAQAREWLNYEGWRIPWWPRSRLWLKAFIGLRRWSRKAG